MERPQSLAASTPVATPTVAPPHPEPMRLRRLAAPGSIDPDAPYLDALARFEQALAHAPEPEDGDH